MNDLLTLSVLFDYYGELLTQMQKRVCELYYNQNLTLSEIAEQFGITRQGVHESLKKAEKSLLSYEQTLRIKEKNNKLSSLTGQIQKILARAPLAPEDKKALEEITEEINSLI